MEESSAHALDEALAQALENTRGWPPVLPIERIKTGITQIALGLFVFVALVAFCCFF